VVTTDRRWRANEATVKISSSRASTSTSASASGPSASGPIRRAREGCHEARDAFYAAACETDGRGGGERTSGKNASGAAAAACVRLREAYERACPASWVAHFDGARTEEEKLAKVLGRKAP